MTVEQESQLDDATSALLRSFAAVSSIGSWSLSGPAALARARVLLQLGEQLTAVCADAVADVGDRELFALDAAGSVRSWLRAQPCGEGAHLTRAGQLGRHPVVDAALRAGGLSAASAATVCSQLDRIPADVPDDQLHGLLVHAVPDLLSAWTGGLILDSDVTETLLARREEAAAVLLACAEAVTAEPAVRLEPVFVLLARTLTPAHLPGNLQALVDALLPEQLAERERNSWDDTYLRIRKVVTGGWDLTVHLDDQFGQTFIDQLDAKMTALLRRLRRDQDNDHADAARDGDPAPQPAVDTEPHGQQPCGDAETKHQDLEPDEPVADPAGGGDSTAADRVTGDAVAVDPADAPYLLLAPADDVVQGCVLRSKKQLLYDAFIELMLDAAAALSAGQPRPAQLTIVTTLASLGGRAGTPPGTLATAHAGIRLPVDTVRRLGCDSTLTAVLHDAHRNPIGASGEHRHATRRERRALRAQWGPTCSVLGCTDTIVVPHHVEPWWLSRHTQLQDLLPICAHHHHDIHEGQRTLRIRDGRLITPTGWGTTATAA